VHRPRSFRAPDEWLETRMPDLPDDENKRHSDNLAVLAVAAIIVILAIIVLHFISANLSTERCLEERRHGCGTDTTP
jgi:hypothetical protein